MDCIIDLGLSEIVDVSGGKNKKPKKKPKKDTEQKMRKTDACYCHVMKLICLGKLVTHTEQGMLNLSSSATLYVTI